MKNLARVSIALVVVAGLGLAVVAFDVIAKQQPGSLGEALFGVQADAQSNDSDANLLAARYHLRTRTTRFFRRATV